MTRKLAVIVVLCSSLSSCQQTTKQTGSTASLARKIAELEAKESKWKAPDSKLAEEAKGQAFNADLAKSVDKALQQDIPGAVLELQKIAQQTQKGPNAKQKKWLEAQVAALTPEALAFLQQVFDDAASTLDLRAGLIASTVAERIKKDGILKSERMKEVTTKVLSGSQGRVYWKVGNSTATRLSGNSYSEQTGGGYASVSVKPGTHLLRVEAMIKNVSNGKDAPYTLGVFDGLKGLLAGFVPDVTVNGVTTKGDDLLAGPHRWLDETLILLATPAGDLIQCGFSVQGSGLRGIPEMAVSGKGIVTPPRAVAPSEDVRFIGLFPVPDAVDSKTLKLLVMGAAPVPIREAPPAKAQ